MQKYSVIQHRVSPGTTFARTGQVTKVTDGDTFDVMRNREEVTMRLYGVDCPEHDQPYGDEAEAFLLECFDGECVQVQEVTIGHYGRIIGLVGGAPPTQSLFGAALPGSMSAIVTGRCMTVGRS